MPTYQYVCTACGQDLEAVQSFSDAALTDCPACAGRLRKKFGSVGVVFKGSGFYRNDSRAGNGSGSVAPAAEKSGEKSGASASSEKKSDGGGSEKSSTGSKHNASSSTSSSGSSSSSSGSGSSTNAA